MSRLQIPFSSTPDPQDLKSSIVVYLVALPLCLGIALASGAPLASGLIAGIVGGIVVGLLSNSHISVSGPAAGLTVIVAAGIIQMGGFENFGVAVMLAGLFQVIFAILKGGNIGDYFPAAVVKGMLAAIGLILILKQLPTALGLPNASFSWSYIKTGSLIISLTSMAIMLGWEQLAASGKKFFKLIPGPLVAVVLSVTLNQVFQLVSAEALVKLPPALFGGLKLPALSGISFATFQLAVTIAIVASIETLLCIDAADKIDPNKRKTNKNAELFAQGIGNSLSGLLGGLPITAVIVRTSANVAAGAKTKYSAVFHGCWLFLSVLIVPGLLNLIPLPSLACVLVLVGYKLTRPALYREMAKRGLDQLFIFCLTIGAILATDLLKGIFIGLAGALLFDLRKPAFSCFEVVHEEDKIHFKFVRNVSFLHKSSVAKFLQSLSDSKMIYFHGMASVRIHVDVHELISEFHEDAKKKNLEIVFFK